MSVLMTPDMANFSGNVHGGTILKLLDQVAYVISSNVGIAQLCLKTSSVNIMVDNSQKKHA
jgi:acyl-CoA hydrolase